MLVTRFMSPASHWENLLKRHAEKPKMKNDEIPPVLHTSVKIDGRTLSLDLVWGPY